MNSALPLLRSILYLREDSKCNIKAAYLFIKFDAKYVNIVSKIPNIVKSDSRHQFCTKTPSLFLRHLLDLQKTSKLHAKSFPLKYDSYYANIFIKIQVRLYQKPIRASLEKMTGAHRSFFLG